MWRTPYVFASGSTYCAAVMWYSPTTALTGFPVTAYEVTLRSTDGTWTSATAEVDPADGNVAYICDVPAGHYTATIKTRYAPDVAPAITGAVNAGA